MITVEQIASLIERVRAPSGDNSQPWNFEWDGRTLRIFHNPIRAAHPLDPDGCASKLAFGCLVRAVEIAAADLGFAVSMQQTSNDDSLKRCWIKLNFSKSEALNGRELAPFLALRSADRRAFQGGTLTLAQFESTLKIMDQFSPAQFHLLETRDAEFTNYICESEEVMGRHAEILPAVLKWVRFSFAEAKRVGDGLTWRNLGVKLWEVPMLPLIKNFPKIMRLAKLTMPAQQNSRARAQLESSAGVVCITLPRSALADLLPAGRLMMQVWLELTKCGYGVQPLTLASTLVYANKMNLLDASFDHKFYERGEEILRRKFGFSDDQFPVWMIRTGKSTPLPIELGTFRLPSSRILR